MEHHLARPVRIQTRARQAPDAVAKLATLAHGVATGVVVRAAVVRAFHPGCIVKLMDVVLRQKLLPQGAGVSVRVLVDHRLFRTDPSLKK
jgi:hypothetical protein